MVILELGGDANVVDAAGQTPLHLSVVHPSATLGEVLIGGGVDIDRQDDEGRTALHMAAAAGRSLIVLQLIEAGADVELMDSKGRTAEQVAVEMDEAMVVRAFNKKDKWKRWKAEWDREHRPATPKKDEAPSPGVG